MRPLLLDLFCGAGGCAKGYDDAGFEVHGVDLSPQPNYPYHFVEGDALAFLAEYGSQYDVIHASPPCQAYSVLKNTLPHLAHKDYPDLLGPTRAALQSVGRPWIIENVPGAPMRDHTLLCGTMFGLRTYRHRWFETSFSLTQPEHPPHLHRSAKLGRRVKEDEFMTVAGHFSSVRLARAIMGIDWMTRDELAQAIPPAYTRWVGEHAREHLRSYRYV